MIFHLLLGDLYLFQHAQDVVLTHEEMFYTVDFNLCSAILGKKDPIPRFNIHRGSFAVIAHLSGADGDDFPLLGLFLSNLKQRVGQKDNLNRYAW